MESSDAFGSSTSPLTWHDFLERMRHPSAADFVKSIKSFIVSFSNNAPDPEIDSTSVQEFFVKMEHAFRAHSLWAGSSEEELESAGENGELEHVEFGNKGQSIPSGVLILKLVGKGLKLGLEKYVMTKLYTRVFASVPEDVKCDERLSEKMALLQQFVRPENLDIKPTFQNETSWLLAQKELQKINMYKAPRDKLGCILNCCRVINNLLLNASIASKENPPGADEFLPVLIYVTIKNAFTIGMGYLSQANPPQLHSNLLYIQRYRRQSRLVSEAAYFFTNMLSAASFIMNIDAKSISMNEIEFEKNMESARALQSGLSTNVDISNQTSEDRDTSFESMEYKHLNVKNEFDNLPSKRHPSPSLAKQSNENPDMKRQSPVTKIPSVSDLEAKGAAELLKEEQGSKIIQTYPYLYANVNDLTVSDVESLLSSYKELVLKYLCLSKGIAASLSSRPPFVSPTQIHNQTEAEKVLEHPAAVEATIENQNDDGRREEGLNEASPLQVEASETETPLDESDTHQPQPKRAQTISSKTFISFESE
ncbi:hypothetical protein Scep_019212 [Stephania cephalantha]|uniref:VPS9 domain-containing protein n=1 Tax=Stephania cephalantha TaxID=152367 RepID=A0AAP0IAS9_9MAGN